MVVGTPNHRLLGQWKKTMTWLSEIFFIADGESYGAASMLDCGLRVSLHGMDRGLYNGPSASSGI